MGLYAACECIGMSFKLVVDYPDSAAEKQVLLNARAEFRAKRLDLARIKPIATVEQIVDARKPVQAIEVEDKFLRSCVHM